MLIINLNKWLKNLKGLKKNLDSNHLMRFMYELNHKNIRNY